MRDLRKRFLIGFGGRIAVPSDAASAHAMLFVRAMLQGNGADLWGGVSEPIEFAVPVSGMLVRTEFGSLPTLIDGGEVFVVDGQHCQIVYHVRTIRSSLIVFGLSALSAPLVVMVCGGLIFGSLDVRRFVLLWSAVLGGFGITAVNYVRARSQFVRSLKAALVSSTLYS